MKRYILILLLVVTVFSCLAEEMTVLGIPLSGSIDSFSVQLKNQGYRISPESKKLPIGQRAFEVRFAGEDALLLVSYFKDSKEVYDAVLTFSSFNKSELTPLYELFKKKLGDKIKGSGVTISGEIDKFHGNPMWRYKYSRNGKYIGASYIYYWDIPADENYDTIYQLNIKYRNSIAPSFEDESQYLF